MKRRVPINECGYRVGEGHHNSTIPDSVVKEIRDLHEFGEPNDPERKRWGYHRLARRFNLPKGTIQKICTYARRGQVAHDYRTIDVPEDRQTD